MPCQVSLEKLKPSEPLAKFKILFKGKARGNDVITLPTFTWPFLVFSLGTCIGSFLNVCICRLPQDRSVVRPGSACPKCGHRLKWWENIPILSFLFLRAKCSSCGARISLQYPLVELLSGLLALVLWSKFGLGPDVLIYFYF